MPPLPTDFIFPEACKPICEKLLTLPSKNLSLPDLIHYLKTKVLDELKKNGNQLKISVFKSQWNLLISENTKKYYKDYYRFIKNFE